MRSGRLDTATLKYLTLHSVYTTQDTTCKQKKKIIQKISSKLIASHSKEIAEHFLIIQKRF